jgi:hypothetical protein
VQASGARELGSEARFDVLPRLAAVRVRVRAPGAGLNLSRPLGVQTVGRETIDQLRGKIRPLLGGEAESVLQELLRTLRHPEIVARTGVIDNWRPDNRLIREALHMRVAPMSAARAASGER